MGDQYSGEKLAVITKSLGYLTVNNTRLGLYYLLYYVPVFDDAYK